MAPLFLDQRRYYYSFMIFMVATLMGGTSLLAKASDPDLISDFFVPPNVTTVDGNYFTYTGFRALTSGAPPKDVGVLTTDASNAEFPALSGQSVSYASLIYARGDVNPPHMHPRSAELLFLFFGALDVGFVDDAGKLYAQTLRAGDMFLFPKGVVHYQRNSGSLPAWAFSAFGSASPGTVSVPSALFAGGIDDRVLAMSFKTDVATIQKIKAGLAPKA